MSQKIIYLLHFLLCSLFIGWLLFQPDVTHANGLPVHKSGRFIQATVTGYSPYETCPYGLFEKCINAAGSRPIPSVSIAAPRAYKLGTRLFIPSLGEFMVDDRTHHRFDGRFDIFFQDYKEAKRFGKRTLTIFIYDSK